VDGLTNIQAERDEENHVDSDLPHVLPHGLVKISTGEFGKAVVDVHLQQLQHSWDEECIAGIEHEHRELITAYRNEPALKSAIEAYARVEIKSFETA
jgi:NADPH-dependent glutamate synthase beta subunit-like oxidoreductase